MNKGEIRTRILEQVDWSPTQSTSFKAKVDRLINRAYQQLSLEAPFLFFEEECKIITRKDVNSDSSVASDALAVATTDKYVLQRTYTTGTAGIPAWDFTGAWDSRMIEVTDSAGTVYRRRIREVWTDVNPQGTTTTFDRISIDHEWPNNSDTGMSYRIYNAAYELPADVVELRSARVWADTHHPLVIMSQNEMERHEYVDYQGNAVGRPNKIFRGRHWQIDAPNRAPTGHVFKESTAWVGPQPIGDFDFCYTYVWGDRPTETKAPSGQLEPRWESAPSPISTKFSVTEAAQTIGLMFPNIDQELNFFREHDGTSVVTPIRAQRSGLRKRIYLRRYTTLSGGPTIHEIESPEIFFLLDEIDGHIISYIVNGSKIPDYYRRLKETHGYQSIRLWPMPDAEYEVDCRVLRRPQLLIHDHDAPRIHEEACSLIVNKALVLFYEMEGKYEVSQLAASRYQDMLTTLTKRYGQIAGLRVRKKFARVGHQAQETRVVPSDIDKPWTGEYP